MTVKCGYEIDSCLTFPDTNQQWKIEDNYLLTHSKHVSTTLNVGDTIIPIRKRDREFSLRKYERTEKDDLCIIYDLADYDHECYVSNNAYELEVTEDAVYIDSTIYILDTEFNNCFWKESVYTINFSKLSTDSAHFNSPSNTYHKCKIDSINILVTTSWKLMLNGVVETLFSESYVKSAYSIEHPLIILWPIPWSLGTPTDADVIQYGFYDYFGVGETLVQQDGGADFYYPEWLRMMGDHREDDQADAKRKYDYTYGGDPDRLPSYELVTPIPTIIGGNDVRGSITRDNKGNTLASVMITKSDNSVSYFNRLIDKNNRSKLIPEVIPGNELRLFPVGII